MCYMKLRLRPNIVTDLIFIFCFRLNLKILYLVRDPRAVMSLRMKLEWCGNASALDCTQSLGICEDLVREYYLAKELEKSYPQQFM